MIVYCNLNGGTGKPLWEITVPEYSVWLKVSLVYDEVSQSTSLLGPAHRALSQLPSSTLR
jgi:hypothetical protein